MKDSVQNLVTDEEVDEIVNEMNKRLHPAQRGGLSVIKTKNMTEDQIKSILEAILH